VVTLVEPHERAAWQVPDLGAEVERRHMDWLYLPNPDGHPPGHAFEAAWETAGDGLRARLRDGADVLVHCKGGLGRAGTVAARLLVEIGSQQHRRIVPRRDEAHVVAQRHTPRKLAMPDLQSPAGTLEGDAPRFLVRRR